MPVTSGFRKSIKQGPGRIGRHERSCQNREKQATASSVGRWPDLSPPLFLVVHREHSDAGTRYGPLRHSRVAGAVAGPYAMKARVFEVILHKLPSGASPASALEEQLNSFLVQFPRLQVVATHMNTVVAPAEPNAMPSSDESTIIIFFTLFYTE